MAGYLGGQTRKPIYTGGLSQGSSRTSSASQGLSGRTQATQRLQSNTRPSTASPATRRQSTAPEDIYKVFPADTGRNDVPFQDRFRTTKADAQPGGGYVTSMAGGTQDAGTQEGGTSAPTAPAPAASGGPTTPVSPLRPPEGGGPSDVAGPVTIPEKPSYLDRPELPDYTEEFQDYEAQTREVQSDETMQGQIKGIMEEGNPLMDLRRSQADQAMAARGLYHSTAGVEAAERAMLESILPIASQDAATYSNQARINQEFLQDASNMNVETFNSEIVAKANQGRQMQLMSYESDIRERLAGVDQRYAIQLETLTQEYNILGEEYKAASTLYSDSLRSMAALLGNNDLTPEQQAAGVESLVGQLEAGLQFMTGVSGGTIGGITPESGGGEPGGEVTEDGEPVAGVSNQSTLGVYPGGEMNSSGQFKDAKLKALDPLEGIVNAHAPDPEILRIDQSSGLPSLVKVGNWYYRPRGWNENNGLGSSQIMLGQGKQYLELLAMRQPEQQRLKSRSDDWIKDNPGGARLGGPAGVVNAPNLYLEIPQ